MRSRKRAMWPLRPDLYSGRTGANPQENMALVREDAGGPGCHHREPRCRRRIPRPASGHDGARSPPSAGATAVASPLTYALGSVAPRRHRDLLWPAARRSGSVEKTSATRCTATFAGQDRGIPVEAVDRFVEALRAAGVENDVHIYDPVQHRVLAVRRSRPPRPTGNQRPTPGDASKPISSALCASESGIANRGQIANRGHTPSGSHEATGLRLTQGPKSGTHTFGLSQGDWAPADRLANRGHTLSDSHEMTGLRLTREATTSDRAL